ncbi:MAG: PIN domain-containing protein [Verrucomicrobiaceae bacterium]|nr:PIN domain-containing protein [Verrucomicrobiaceae bacterium]
MASNLAYLLDSSACIPVLRNKLDLSSLPSPAKCGIPMIVAAELWTGVKKSLNTHPHQAAKLEAFLSMFPIRDFNMNAALHYAEIRATLESKGQSIGPLDMLIAAQARSLGATLVTGNTAEFKRVPGLKVFAIEKTSTY